MNLPIQDSLASRQDVCSRNAHSHITRMSAHKATEMWLSLLVQNLAVSQSNHNTGYPRLESPLPKV